MQNYNGESLSFNAGHRLKRSIDQLIGICAGIAADGNINDAEIAYLATWLRENRDEGSLAPVIISEQDWLSFLGEPN